MGLRVSQKAVVAGRGVMDGLKRGKGRRGGEHKQNCRIYSPAPTCACTRTCTPPYRYYATPPRPLHTCILFLFVVDLLFRFYFFRCVWCE
jgi:hypothetical protein